MKVRFINRLLDVGQGTRFPEPELVEGGREEEMVGHLTNTVAAKALASWTAGRPVRYHSQVFLWPETTRDALSSFDTTCHVTCPSQG